MINIERILKQSWTILWNYRVLWIFGLLLAMTSGGSNPSQNLNYTFDRYDPVVRDFNPDDMPAWLGLRELTTWFVNVLVPVFENPSQNVRTIALFIVGMVLFIFTLGLLAAVIRYPTETAILRMVDHHGQTGEKLGFRAGWRLGWSRRAFRIWVLDLIFVLPAMLLVGLLAATGVGVYAIVQARSEAVAVFGGLALVGIFFLILVIFLAGLIFLLLLRQFFVRAAALDGLGVVDSLRTGWGLFRRQWRSAGLMWLVLAGIGIAFGLGMLVVWFVLIPAYILMFLPALVAGVVPALLIHGLARILLPVPLAGVIGILVGLAIFFSVLFSPLLLVNGWYKVFDSSVWTLAYREMQALEKSAAALPEDLPAPS